MADDSVASNGLANLITLVLMLSSSAGGYLEAALDPEKSGDKQQNLELARMVIDLLGVLQDKTRGNLDEDENKALETALTQLRLQYVRLSS
jgi:hypothetical protein